MEVKPILYKVEWSEDEMQTLYNVLDLAKDQIITNPHGINLTAELEMIEQMQDLRYKKV